MTAQEQINKIFEEMINSVKLAECEEVVNE